jgi:hypothetical protein
MWTTVTVLLPGNFKFASEEVPRYWMSHRVVESTPFRTLLSNLSGFVRTISWLAAGWQLPHSSKLVGGNNPGSLMMLTDQKLKWIFWFASFVIVTPKCCWLIRPPVIRVT